MLRWKIVGLLTIRLDSRMLPCLGVLRPGPDADQQRRVHILRMSAHDLHIGKRVFIDRGHGPGNPAYGYCAVGDPGALPEMLGL